MRRVGRLISLGGHLLWGMVLVGTLVLLRLVAPRRHEAALASAGRRWLADACRLLGVDIEVAGSMQTGPVLLVANHISWLDVLVIGALTGPAFVAKAEVAGWPVLGRLARQAGTLFVQRGSHASAGHTLDLMTWRLVRGLPVVIFPEGTTTAGDRVLRFRGRLFQAASRAGCPVQPVALSYRCADGTVGPVPYTGAQTFVANLWMLTAEPAVTARLALLPPLAGRVEEPLLAGRAQTAIREALYPDSAIGAAM